MPDIIVTPVYRHSVASYILQGSGIGALAFLAYDICITFGDEVEYIWSMPRTSTLKWLYIFLRYFSLLTQTILRYKPYEIEANFPPPRHLCIKWYYFEVWSQEALMVGVEIVLMTRVWVLYNRAYRSLIFLGLLVTLEVLIMGIIIVKSAPELLFSSQCVQTVTPSTMVTFVIGLLFSHFIVLGCTLYKCMRFIRSGWGRKTPLISLLLRDATYTFAGLCGIILLDTIVYSKIDKSLSTLAAPWVVSIMGVAGCRIIVNMHHLALKGNRGDPSPIEISTFIFDASTTSTVLTTGIDSSKFQLPLTTR